jgi:hypothetical protein
VKSPLPSPRSVAEDYVPAGVKDAVRHFLAECLVDRVVTYKELGERPEVDVWQFGAELPFTFEEPAYYNILPDEIERIVGDHVSHQPYVLEAPGVELVGRQGMKLTGDGEFVVYNFGGEGEGVTGLEVAYDIVDALSMGTWPFSETYSPHDVERVDHAVPLVNRWARNYSHWTEECLAQLEGLEHYVEQTGERPLVLVPPDAPSYIHESLAHFGYDEDEYRELSATRVYVERMVLPSVRRVWSSTSDDYMRDPFGIRWVRNQVLDAIDVAEEGPRKLLISREQDATERRITNWREVESALHAEGFNTVVLTELNFVEQKRLFHDADVIVGTHGAGLTELIYAEDCAVVELFGSYTVPPYYEMAEAVGHEYGCLVCEPRGADIRVDVGELLAAIESVREATTCTT